MKKFKNTILTSLTLLTLPLITRAQDVSLPNPLPAENIPKLISFSIRGILGVVGAIALLMLVWGGITWMTSQGSADRVKRGKETITWAVFGLAIIFMSYAIVRFVLEALQSS